MADATNVFAGMTDAQRSDVKEMVGDLALPDATEMNDFVQDLIYG